jgi:hypothetical protein
MQSLLILALPTLAVLSLGASVYLCNVIRGGRRYL